MKNVKQRILSAILASALMIGLFVGVDTIEVKGSEATYTVKENDTLWGIAGDFYNDGAKFKDIYSANKNVIKNPDRIYPGQVLLIPGVSEVNKQPKEDAKVKTDTTDTPAGKDRVKEIFDSLTLKEKIGQMIMPDVRSWNDEENPVLNDEVKKAIEEYKFGGIILFSENARQTETTARLVCDLQNASKIPMLISIDQEGGYITRLGTGTATIGNMALGAIGDSETVKESAAIIGSELSALGINVNFGPVVDVNNNPGNPVIGVRSFSDNPDVVAKLAPAYIEGLHSKNVISALKHFPGHGDTQTDSHSGLPLINKNLDELRGFELVPFKAGVDAGADMIMTAHISYPEIEKETYVSKSDGKEISLPATLSKTIITDLLRNELGFDGVVCTDAMEMDAISKHFDRLDAATLAINAGVDILLMPAYLHSVEDIADFGKYLETIVSLVENGKIKKENVDKSVMRILKLKEKHGLLSGVETNGDIKAKEALEVVGSKPNHDKEWEMAKRAVTLVKNESMIPIKGETLVLCQRTGAVKATEFAMSLLENDPSYKVLDFTELEAISDEIKSEIKKAKNIIVIVSTTSPAAFTSDAAKITDAVIENAHSQGKKVAIISSHLPYDLARFQSADVLIAAYSNKGTTEIPVEYNGNTMTYGANTVAAVYAAMGGCEFSGRLPVKVPDLGYASVTVRVDNGL